jgi:hypothetical protein
MKNEIRPGGVDRLGDRFRIADVADLMLHSACQIELFE